PDTLHDMRGISRSVTALLWGMAQADGEVPGLDTRVLDLYPKLAKLKRDGREIIAIRHLLNMSAGLRWKEEGAKGDAFGLSWRPNPIEFVLDRPMAGTPGNLFCDSSGCTAVLADLLSDRVGMSIDDYARVKLFGPLGITDFEWRKDLMGRVRAHDGLRLKPRDLVHIGRMVMWGGQWQGLSLIPADLIAASTQALIDTRQPAIAPNYGYGWWSGAGTALGHPLRWQAAVGGGAERLFMIPNLDLIVVIMAGNYDEVDESAQRLFEHIVGAVRA
ncbi:MAG: serine hydrolase domain-containing protein, partial [Asticcacaulis sp.]